MSVDPSAHLPSIRHAIRLTLSQLSEARTQLQSRQAELSGLQNQAFSDSTRLRTVSKIMRDIDLIRPLYDRARNKLDSIDRLQLAEVTSYSNPPNSIKICLEAVVFLLYDRVIPFRDLLRELTGSQFIEAVKRFKPETLSEKKIEKIRKDYVNRQWKVREIYKASVAVGQLAEWLEAQLNYREVMLKVLPLTGELDSLVKREALATRAAEEVAASIKQAETLVQLLESRAAFLQGLEHKILAGGALEPGEFEEADVVELMRFIEGPAEKAFDEFVKREAALATSPEHPAPSQHEAEELEPENEDLSELGSLRKQVMKDIKRLSEIKSLSDSVLEANRYVDSMVQNVDGFQGSEKVVSEASQKIVELADDMLNDNITELGNDRKFHKPLNTSTAQQLNTSTAQQLNTSTPQQLNTSTPQQLNTSTPQQLNTSTAQQLNTSTALNFEVHSHSSDPYPVENSYYSPMIYITKPPQLLNSHAQKIRSYWNSKNPHVPHPFKKLTLRTSKFNAEKAFIESLDMSGKTTKIL